MEQMAIHEASQVALWIGFAVGVLARWGDRAHHVISESPSRSVVGFLEHNWMRLLIRLVVTCYAFYLVLGQGWVISEFIAFSVGVSADTLTESVVDRAKTAGEHIIKRKNGGDPT